MPTFGDKLRELLDGQHLSHQDFAKKLGISRQTVSNYINGKREPEVSTIVAIAQALGGIDLNELLMGTARPAGGSNSVALGPVAAAVHAVEQAHLGLDADMTEAELLDAIIPALVRKRRRLGPVPGEAADLRGLPLGNGPHGDYTGNACGSEDTRSEDRDESK